MGDDGTTRLIGGKRVTKDSLRIEASGTLDELNALIGVVRSYRLLEKIDKVLKRIQNSLFRVGAELALPEEAANSAFKISSINGRDIVALEKEIDTFEARLKPLQKFILPGGTSAGAMLHMARTIARRTERRCVGLSRVEQINPQIIRYLNRLSDLLFALARYVNQQQAQQESHPTFVIAEAPSQESTEKKLLRRSHPVRKKRKD